MRLPNLILIASFYGLMACSPSSSPDISQGDVIIEEVSVGDLPAEVLSLVLSARDGFQPLEVQKKTRSGRVYYDIEGELTDGSELEFDVLMTSDGPEIVEIQRDLAFEVVPESVRVLALKASGGDMPARIIESVQKDKSIIYEFFLQGKPKDPAFEVKFSGGEASLLNERWEH